MKGTTLDTKGSTNRKQGIRQKAKQPVIKNSFNWIGINNYVSKIWLAVLLISISCIALANSYTSTNNQAQNTWAKFNSTNQTVSFLAQDSNNKTLDKYKDFKDYLEVIWAVCLDKGFDKAYISSAISSEITDSILMACTGIMYNLDQDYQNAIIWYEKVADKNLVVQNILGQMNYYGLGVNQNPEKAIEWYTKAAEQDYSEAQYNLGNMFLFGQGVERDIKKGLEWLTRAGNQEHVKARYSLARFAEAIKEDEIAVSWYKGSANLGYAPAQYSLALRYINGQGVPQDYDKAIELYTNAAKQGNLAAQTNLGLLYFNGQVVDKDYKKAFQWLAPAAEQGDSLAQKALGLMYKQGWGVEQSDEQSDYWFKKSEEN